MNRRALFAIVFLGLPLRAEAQTNWNQGLAGSVYASAFAFMEPRTLSVIPTGELTLWGLRGLTALDPSVGPTMAKDTIDLVDREQVVLSMQQPRPNDAAGWGAVAAQLCGRAAQLSPAIAEAGTGGIVTSFFDKLFNHLDPYSRYVPPTSGEADTATGDPGLTIAITRHRAVVGAIDPAGSASAAGVELGDRIVAIDGVPTRGEDAYALLDPNTVAKIYGSLTKQIQHAQQAGLQPIVLTSPQTRLALKRLTERAAPSLVVLSYSEIAPGLRVESIGQISTTADDSIEPVGV